MIPWRDRLITLFHRRGWRGATWLHHRLAGGRRIMARALNGVVLQVDPGEYVDRFVLREGYYESEVLDALLSALPIEGVLWDIGGNLGLHSISIALALPKSSVVVFEPNPEMVALINAHAKMNLVQVSIIDQALDELEGDAELHLYQGNAGRGSLQNHTGSRASRKVAVRTTTGDSVIAAGLAPAPDVVKIDVEGAEERVLRGMREVLLSERLKAVVFEDAPGEKTSVKELLRSTGFKLKQLVRREQTQHPLCNFLATK